MVEYSLYTRKSYSLTGKVNIKHDAYFICKSLILPTGNFNYFTINFLGSHLFLFIVNCVNCVGAGNTWPSLNRALTLCNSWRWWMWEGGGAVF